jgi:phosphonopyruvate decarboxylase
MMIKPEDMYLALKNRGVELFAGVPDSLLKNFCAYVDDNCNSSEHIITANEGNAIALASGFHLSTGKVAVVYMQNSGLGNAINPLTSLTDPEVYKIPLLMMIGWRGEPGVKDEPQHIKQGRITPAQLELLEIPYWVLDADSDYEKVLSEVFEKLNTHNAPVALLVRKNTYANYKIKDKPKQKSILKREEVLRKLLMLINPDDLLVSTTGLTSRELFELRVERDELQRDFLTVGAMGHTASIALGVALGNPNKHVICIDGDGSVLMHLGAMPIIGSLKPPNFLHILLNNGAHESVGGQPTVAENIDFSATSRAFGYQAYYLATNVEELEQCWNNINKQQGPVLLEVRICTGFRDNLARPTSTPEENKKAFMDVAID